MPYAELHGSNIHYEIQGQQSCQYHDAPLGGPTLDRVSQESPSSSSPALRWPPELT